MRLLTASAAATGTAQRITRPDQFFTFYAYGTFDGATARLEVSPDGTNWFDAGILLEDTGVQNVEFRAKDARAVIEGGSGNTSISVDLV